MTLWQYLKADWKIKKSVIKEMGIDPDKDWGDVTLRELGWIAGELDVLVSDLV